MNFLLKCDKNLRFSCCWVILTTWKMYTMKMVTFWTTNLLKKKTFSYNRIEQMTLLTVKKLYLQLSREKALKLLLQAECERKPAHVGSLTTLPEVNHTLEVLFRLLVLVLSFSFITLLFFFILLILDRHPVPAKQHTNKVSQLLFFKQMKETAYRTLLTYRTDILGKYCRVCLGRKLAPWLQVNVLNN